MGASVLPHPRAQPLFAKTAHGACQRQRRERVPATRAWTVAWTISQVPALAGHHGFALNRTLREGFSGAMRRHGSNQPCRSMNISSASNSSSRPKAAAVARRSCVACPSGGGSSTIPRRRPDVSRACALAASCGHPRRVRLPRVSQARAFPAHGPAVQVDDRDALPAAQAKQRPFLAVVAWCSQDANLLIDVSPAVA